MKSTILIAIIASVCLPTYLLAATLKNDWTDLKVTFGLNPFNSNYFASLPLTEQRAIQSGWTKDKDCSQGFRGSRYVLKGDKAILLVYDQSGNIAAIGTNIPKGLPFDFPSKNIQQFLVDEGDSFVSYLYFIAPIEACSTPSSKYGEKLIIVGDNGQVSLSLNENKVDPFWTKGKCFVAMGNHWWADASGRQGDAQTKRDDFFPIFGLYNKGKLTGFGWVFMADLNSNRYEHPPWKQTLPVMLDQVPSFFYDPNQFGGKLSAIHVYFDSNPRLTNFC